MFLFELLVDLVGDLLDRSATLYSGYKAAWRKRQRSGDESVDLLLHELQVRHVLGAHDPLDSPRIAPAITAWESGRRPREVRRELRRVPKTR